MEIPHNPSALRYSGRPRPETITAPKIEVRGLKFFYGDKCALQGLDLTIREKCVTAFIGPSGCGKTTLLRCFNRMHDLYRGARYEGSVRILPDNLELIGAKIDPAALRMRIGMVFQKPNPFPKSIFANVAYGLRQLGLSSRSEIAGKVEHALRAADLWKEVQDRLHESGSNLSGGQQQRLCIARAIAPEPEVLLLDEPTSALDPIATSRIEELIHVLRDKFTVVIVTHNMQQAARVSDYTAFMYLGELVEFGATEDMFMRPREGLTEQYLRGRFG